MNVAILICLCSALAFIAAIGIGEEKVDLRFGQAHHEYWGALLAGLGFWWGAWPWHPTLAAPLYWSGAVLMADDALEHSVQRLTGDYYWQSPVHQAYGWLYARWALLRRVNETVDRWLA